MTTGLSLSAASAVALGISSVVLAVAARSVGTVIATGATLVIAFLPLAALAAGLRVPLRFPFEPTLLVAVAGALVAVAYLAAIESLRLGPIAVTSPIGAAAGAATVIASFVLLGERPTAGQWIGVAIVGSGAILASITRTGSGVHLVGLGPLYALVAVAFGAVANALVRDPIREIGALQVIVAERSFTLLVLLLVLAGLGRRLSAGRRAAGEGRGGLLRSVRDHRVIALLLVLGALDAAAFLAFAFALDTGPAWLVGLVSQSGRALAVLGGVMLFGERLARLQWTGVALLAAGLGVLSAFSA